MYEYLQLQESYPWGLGYDTNTAHTSVGCATPTNSYCKWQGSLQAIYQMLPHATRDKQLL